MSESSEKPSKHVAPLVVFGGIFAIGITTVTVVLHSHCTKDPYEYDEMAPVPVRELAPGVYEPDE